MTAHCPDPRPLPRGLPPSSGQTSNSTQPGLQVLWCLRPAQSLNCFCFFSSLVSVFLFPYSLYQFGSWIAFVHIFNLLICIRDCGIYLLLRPIVVLFAMPVVLSFFLGFIKLLLFHFLLAILIRLFPEPGTKISTGFDFGAP